MAGPTYLDELKAQAAAGVSRLALSSTHAHLAMREHLQAGGRFKDHRVAVAVIRAMNTRDEITDPAMMARVEAKLFEILKDDPIHGVTIERA